MLLDPVTGQRNLEIKTNSNYWATNVGEGHIIALYAFTNEYKFEIKYNFTLEVRRECSPVGITVDAAPKYFNYIINSHLFGIPSS